MLIMTQRRWHFKLEKLQSCCNHISYSLPLTDDSTTCPQNNSHSLIDEMLHQNYMSFIAGCANGAAFNGVLFHGFLRVNLCCFVCVLLHCPGVLLSVLSVINGVFLLSLLVSFMVSSSCLSWCHSWCLFLCHSWCLSRYPPYMIFQVNLCVLNDVVLGAVSVSSTVSS